MGVVDDRAHTRPTTLVGARCSTSVMERGNVSRDRLAADLATRPLRADRAGVQPPSEPAVQGAVE